MKGINEAFDESHNHIEFYIKTIQFFNELGEKKNEPILVEQVFG